MGRGGPSAWLSSCSSSSLTLEFHLCNLNVASSKISTAPFFRCSACATVCPPVSKSSTYRLLRSSATISGHLPSHESIWCSIIPARRNGEGANPNNTLVNLSVSKGECSPHFQWKRRASRSFSLTRTCRKAFWMSPGSEWRTCREKRRRNVRQTTAWW